MHTLINTWVKWALIFIPDAPWLSAPISLFRKCNLIRSFWRPLDCSSLFEYVVWFFFNQIFCCPWFCWYALCEGHRLPIRKCRKESGLSVGREREDVINGYWVRRTEQMEMATSDPHHVLVVSDSLDVALIRTAQSTKRTLFPMSSHLGFGAGVKRGCDCIYYSL